MGQEPTYVALHDLSVLRLLSSFFLDFMDMSQAIRPVLHNLPYEECCLHYHINSLFTDHSILGSLECAFQNNSNELGLTQIRRVLATLQTQFLASTHRHLLSPRPHFSIIQGKIGHVGKRFSTRF